MKIKILPLLILLCSCNLFALEPIEIKIQPGSAKKLQSHDLLISIQGLAKNDIFYLARWQNKLFYRVFLLDFSGKLYKDNHKPATRQSDILIGQRVDFRDYGSIEYSIQFFPNSRFNASKNNHYLTLVLVKDAKSSKLIFSDLYSFYLNESFFISDFKVASMSKIPEDKRLAIKDLIIQEIGSNKSEISRQISSALNIP